MIQLLLDRGADIDAKDNAGNTALHDAAERGYLGIVQFLLKKGANIEAKNNAGNTPIALAHSNHHTDVIEFFLGKCVKLGPDLMHSLFKQCNKPSQAQASQQLQESTFTALTNPALRKNCTTSSAGRLTGFLPQGLGYVVRGATSAVAAFPSFGLDQGTLLLGHYLASYWSGSYRDNIRNTLKVPQNNHKLDHLAQDVDQALQLGEKKGWG